LNYSKTELDYEAGQPGSCPGHYDIIRKIGNMVAVISGLHTKNFSANYLQFGHVLSKTVRQPCPRLKKFKECRF